jgi:hypothetical protein
MKRTIFVLLFLVISALIIILPYKEHTPLFLGPNVKSAIYEDIVAIFTSGLWINVALLFVLLPLVLLLQVKRSPLTWYKKVFFILEGIFALLAAFVMLCVPLIQLLLMVLTPIYYLSLAWVLLGAIASFLLASKKLYDKAAKLIYS